MIHLALDRTSSSPAYRQLMDQVCRYIASGVLHPGDKLPSIRKTATYIGVNPTTVVRAYRELESDGLIESRHGKGAFVTDGAQLQSGEERLKALAPLAEAVAVQAIQLGADREALLRAVSDAFDNLNGRSR